MAVKIELSEEIERPVDVVFKFYATDHVHNHPRWDPYMELWLDSDSPVGVGTVIRRRNSRSGTPVEGTMEVVEYEPNRAFAVVTHDGPMEIRGRVTFDSMGPELTKITLNVVFPSMDDSMQASMSEAIKGGYRKIKELIESET
jgi:hypothetical protein